MLLIIQNHGEVPAGLFGKLLGRTSLDVRTVRADLGDPLPVPEEAAAVIILGGYMGVHDTQEFPFLFALKRFIGECLAAGIPLLGICLGGQLLAEVCGGEVSAGHCGEKGVCQVNLTREGEVDHLFTGCSPSFPAFQWHNDSFLPPSSATLLASSKLCPGQAFRIGRAWGVQFHPEVDGHLVRSWTAASRKNSLIQDEFARSEVALRFLGVTILSNFLAVAGINSSPLQ